MAKKEKHVYIHPNRGLTEKKKKFCRCVLHVAKNNPNYYRVDALVQTAFDLMLTYKGTNAKDTGNCEKLVSLAN